MDARLRLRHPRSPREDQRCEGATVPRQVSAIIVVLPISASPDAMFITTGFWVAAPRMMLYAGRIYFAGEDRASRRGLAKSFHAPLSHSRVFENERDVRWRCVGQVCSVCEMNRAPSRHSET